jgi:D-cysteine desulfhydrase
VFELRWPDRVPLAHIPTPLEPAPAFGPRVWIKRDDLTGSALSGNKVRKLEFLLAEAQRRDHRRVVTCGGVNSNHARATAVAAAQLGLQSHLVLRGSDRRPPVGNLLLDRFVGAHVHFIDPTEWPQVTERMAALADDHGDCTIIPEGGSNGLGALGYARAAYEILEGAEREGLEVKRVVHAVGSGGTTAGLALGFAAAGRTDVEVLGVCVCDDAAHFDRRIRSILDDAVAQGYAPSDSGARWTIREGFVGAGYALTSAAEMRRLSRVAQSTGLVFDPVYTGKALFGLLAEPPPSDGVTVFVHTGGIFELFAYADLIGQLDAPGRR